MTNITTIILAAGRSTRMKSALPKVLHQICGNPLVSYTMRTAEEAGARETVLVISPDFEKEFISAFGEKKGLMFATQEKQLGTADAVKTAIKKLDRACEHVLIIPGDVPLIQASTLKKLMDETVKAKAVLGLLTMEMSDPASYGRIVRDREGGLKAIIEAKDSTAEQLLIREVNSGIYFVDAKWLANAIEKITPKNAQNEFYLTDVVGIAASEGKKMAVFCAKDENETMGVNTRKELAEANRLMRYRILGRLMNEGVGILDELHTYIDDGVNIGQDTVIYPHCFISGRSTIGKNCIVENGVVIKNMKIGDNVHVRSYSVLEDSEVMNSVQIGPFARLRPGALIEDSAKVGNFVEIKKATLKKGAKANHLTYIGDAVIGERTNVGCGMITCNYDGKNKFKTIVGNDVFIGSDVQFVAPVEIGNNVTIAAGSTITENIPENSLAIARSRQVVKKGWKPKR